MKVVTKDRSQGPFPRRALNRDATPLTGTIWCLSLPGESISSDVYYYLCENLTATKDTLLRSA